MSIKIRVFNQTRDTVVNKMKVSIGDKQWNENIDFIDLLKDTLKIHPLNRHPIIDALNDGKISRENLVKIHLEYRYAIAQIFTDALLMAQYQTRQLELRFQSGIKMYPRFLLGLNVFEEFGFNLNSRDLNDIGNPDLARYPKFEKVLDELEVGSDARKRYIPSKSAKKVRQYLENSFFSYTSILALLAVVEMEALIFSSPLSNALKNIGIHIDGGYCLEEGGAKGDLWFALAHACTKEDYINIYEICLKYCDLWNEFWDHQLKICN